MRAFALDLPVQMKRLSEISSQPHWFEIEKLDGEAVLSERLTEMGLVPGALIKVHGRLPFGGPISIQLGNGFLALREAEAACLLLRRSEK